MPDMSFFIKKWTIRSKMLYQLGSDNTSDENSTRMHAPLAFFNFSSATDGRYLFISI